MNNLREKTGLIIFLLFVIFLSSCKASLNMTHSPLNLTPKTPLGYSCQNRECVVNINDTQCEKLSVNNEGNNKINIIFVPDNVSQGKLDSFKNRLMSHVDIFYQTEPFKSHKAVLNFYFLNTTQPFSYNGQISFDSNRLGILSSTCNYNISQFIIVTKEHVFTPAMLGERMASTPIDDPWTTLHEFGHSFAGLSDTYYPTINHQGTGAFGYDAPNTDEGGCKKWCTSDTGVYNTECTRITDENECKQHERTPNEWGWGCNSPEKCCVWLYQQDPFFKSQCVNVRDHKNIGINCLEKTGCYYGTNYQGKWRPNDDFDTNSYMGIMGGDVIQPWRYDPVSIRTINLKIQCCYPQQNNNYPTECKNYSEKYNAFSGCNSSLIS